MSSPSSWNFPQLFTPQTSPASHPTRSFRLQPARMFDTVFAVCKGDKVEMIL